MEKREIKFKVYDKIHNSFIYPSNLVFRLDGHLFDRFLNEEIHDYEMLQFTGLRDKNNVELFEGDILIYCGAIGFVFYNPNSCMFMIKFPVHKSFWSFDSIEEEFEIIGNIIENKDIFK